VARILSDKRLAEPSNLVAIAAPIQGQGKDFLHYDTYQSNTSPVTLVEVTEVIVHVEFADERK